MKKIIVALVVLLSAGVMALPAASVPDINYLTWTNIPTQLNEEGNSNIVTWMVPIPKVDKMYAILEATSQTNGAGAVSNVVVTWAVSDQRDYTAAPAVLATNVSSTGVLLPGSKCWSRIPLSPDTRSWVPGTQTNLVPIWSGTLAGASLTNTFATATLNKTNMTVSVVEIQVANFGGARYFGPCNLAWAGKGGIGATTNTAFPGVLGSGRHLRLRVYYFQ